MALAGESATPEERAENQRILDAVAQNQEEDKLRKRRALKLDEQYDNCVAAETRSLRRLAEIDAEATALSEKRVSEQANLDAVRADRTRLAKECKEQYGLGQAE